MANDLKSAFPEKFEAAKSEFDIRRISNELAPKSDSIKKDLLSKTFAVKDENFTISDYDFKTHRFRIDMSIIEADPNWEKHLYESIENLDRAFSGKKIKKPKIATTHADYAYVAGQLGNFSGINITYKIHPFSDLVKASLKAEKLSMSLKIENQNLAQIIAEWRGENNDNLLDVHRGSVYIECLLENNFIDQPNGKNLIADPMNVLFVTDRNELIFHTNFFVNAKREGDIFVSNKRDELIDSNDISSKHGFWRGIGMQSASENFNITLSIKSADSMIVSYPNMGCSRILQNIAIFKKGIIAKEAISDSEKACNEQRIYRFYFNKNNEIEFDAFDKSRALISVGILKKI